ncbi:MAG: NADPH-dependent glutamate synthase [Planctomycetes bacterium]|nr:NADPH-dependent glutamate synthase [Planctomycetota bacterium]
MSDQTAPPKLSAKDRLAIQRQDMPVQDATARAAAFTEVNLGYELENAVVEAQRCLECKNAKCVQGCPVNVDIPRFVSLVAARDLAGAARALLGDNALPAVTGRVCPQETQCEAQCIRGIKGKPVAIGNLERFVADWARTNLATDQVRPDGPRVAVVGSGPCGLTAAGELARLGYRVTVYEAFHTAGGVLVYGIPEFRLPKEIVASEVDRLRAMGVEIAVNVVVGKTLKVQELLADHVGVVIGVGAGLPAFMEVPGEDLKGVYSANEFLTRVNLMGAFDFPRCATPVLKGRRVAVVGGGNVAMDAVRTAKRLGAEEACIVYRRGHDDLPARAEEVHHAEEEGIAFRFNVAPTRVLGDEQGWVKGLEVVRMVPGEPDASGRRRPVAQKGSEEVMPFDQVIVAIGTRANPLLTATLPELKLTKYGNIAVDEQGMTSIPGVFAGGDITRGAATVILAMGDGKVLAKSLHNWLQQGAAAPCAGCTH